MLQTRRSLLHAIKRTTTRTHQRRYESSTGHASSAGTVVGAPHPPVPHSPNQHFGRGFYVTLAIIPVSYALYQYSFSDDENPPLFTRLITKYSNYHDRWAERDEIHTRMMEQAAHDRLLFVSSRQSLMIDLDFPEVFNTGSPYNIPAGHSANLDEVIAHYEKRNREVDAKREARQRAAEIAEAEGRSDPPVVRPSTAV